MLAFAVGALLPLMTMVVATGTLGIWLTVVAVLVALTITGFVSARLGGAPPSQAVARNVLGGAFAMAVTFGIGSLLGTQIG